MLKLRAYRPGDAARIISWMEDEYAFRQWSADRFPRYPITPEELNADYAARPEGSFCPMMAEDGSGPAGHLFIRVPDPARPTVRRLGFVVVDGSRRSRGLGRELVELGAAYAFAVLGAELLTLGVFENNPRALRCYQAAGFHVVPGREDITCMGEVWTCLSMERTRRSGEGGRP